MSYIQKIPQLLIRFSILIALQWCVVFSVQANQANIVDVKITSLGDNRYRIDTTLRHSDTGWKHYANAWQVFDQSGKLLGERVLHHPHVNEQPFTRSATIIIPADVKKVTIRAKDSLHGLNKNGMTVYVPKK